MIRNLITTLKKFRTSSILNIVGLTVAYTAFIIITLQIITEYSYDKSYSDSDRIYRVERPSWSDKNKWSTSISRPIIDAITNSSPAIEEFAIIRHNYENPNKSTTWRTESSDNENGLIKGYPIEINNSFPQMFGMQMIEGNLVDEPEKVIIPKSLATKVFGNESAMGKTFINVEDNKKSMTVSGVYADFPNTSSFPNNIYCHISNKEVGLHNYVNYVLFVKLRQGTDIKTFEDKIIQTAIDAELTADREENVSLRLHKISDIHFATDLSNSNVTYANTQKIQLFGLFALIIIIIASINYINFATALVPLRVRGINTRKVFGASVSSLRIQLIGEAIGISVIAYLIAATFILTLNNLNQISFISTQIDIINCLPTIILIGIIAIILGILAGAYPAFYSTSFKTVYILKGSFSLSPKGRTLRSILVGFQFVISIGLIIAAMFMNLQFSMIKNQNLGIDREHIIQVNVTGKVSSKTEELKQKITNFKGVTAVTNTPFNIVNSWYSEYFFKDPDGNDKESFKISILHGPSNIVDFFGLQIIDGQNFTSNDDLKSANNTILINQSAQKKYNLKVGDKLGHPTSFNGYVINTKEEAQWEIIGVIKDFNFKPLYQTIEPLIILNYGTESNFESNIIYVKAITDDYSELIQNITAAVKELDPNWVANISFLDSQIEALYQSDMRSASLVSWFSLLAILISLAGVFGLVHFEMGHRRKEIGLRKINGASIITIISMVSRKFILITVVCYVIATPLAIYCVNEWLSVFAYRTPLHWWVFAMALIIVIIITLITVLIQSYRAAACNPINAIKAE